MQKRYCFDKTLFILLLITLQLQGCDKLQFFAPPCCFLQLAYYPETSLCIILSLCLVQI